MSTKKVTRIERGWAGHFICGDRCLFRRNTLIERNGEKIVVSTVGAMRENGKIETIGGGGRYYETMAFEAKQDGPYIEADTYKEIMFDSNWSICAASLKDLPDNVDNLADAMHEAVVLELIGVE